MKRGKGSSRRGWAACMVMALLASITVAASPAGAQDAQYASQADAVLGSAGNTQWRQAVQNVINPEDHVCIEPGAIGFWINDVINSAQPSSLDVLFPVGAPDWPIVYKLFFDDDDTDEFIGVDGAYTREHIKRQRDLINFWDVPLDDVGLYGIHGSVMADDNKMIPVVQFMLGVPPDIAQLIVDDVQYVIENDPGVGYDWPLFSFNAVAFGPDPLKVVMGDGLIEFFEDSGLATNGVDSVYAHEIGHQVQGVLGELDGPPSPEATRRIELMADAFATYYLAHARGASFNAKRALDVFESSFNAGDCGFDSDGHHGTPNQRMAASEWGAEIAQDGPRGEIKTAAQMVALFDEQLPIIVAPDAP